MPDESKSREILPNRLNHNYLPLKINYSLNFAWKESCLFMNSSPLLCPLLLYSTHCWLNLLLTIYYPSFLSFKPLDYLLSLILLKLIYLYLFQTFFFNFLNFCFRMTSFKYLLNFNYTSMVYFLIKKYLDLSILFNLYLHHHHC